MSANMQRFPITRATLPREIGVLHFVGIGGIGMSGIAELMHNLGYRVQGSDIAENYTLERLRKLGIKVMVGAHTAAHVQGASAVVISSAVKPSNPEVVEARAKRIPVVRRAEMLAELMRLKTTISIAGTHGKTTTTSLISTLFMAADLKPTVVNGGIINAYGTNAILGESEWMVVEADESDGTFIRIPSTIAVVTNIDPEHLDHYGSFESLKNAFRQFLEQLPFYGFGVLCIDHPEVQTMLASITDRRMITYGTSPQADVRAVNIRHSAAGQLFDVEMADMHNGEVRVLKDIQLPMYGLHNVRNACAAVAVAREVGISDAVMVKGLREFRGVKRRFTKTGESNGITVIDDYGHHPVEISATLGSARQAVTEGGKVIAVVQPHRYTRLSHLFKEFATCFNDADVVLVADVYSAGEEPIEGANRDALTAAIRDHGHRQVIALPSPDMLAELLVEIAVTGDLIVCLGAGSISQWAYDLPAQLDAQFAKRAKVSA